MERPVKRSVSLAIFHGDDVLIVQRPPDDEDLPNAWGLPAASLKLAESWQDAALRAGRDKLGVELEVVGELKRGTLDRAAYTLEMRLYEARVVSGQPSVPQPNDSATQYQQLKWNSGGELMPAAAAGSLCCRLFLAYKDSISS